MPNVFGLVPFYRDLAERFAAEGFEAIALDYYGRSAQDQARGDAFDWARHRSLTTPGSIACDVRACVAELRREPLRPVGPVFTVGFSWGGANSLRQSAEGWGAAGAIAFYSYQPLTLLPDVPRMTAPLLMIEAGSDPTDEHEALVRQLLAHGVPFESHVLDGAPHNFFDQHAVRYPAACAESWRLILAFARAHSRPER